MPYIARDYTGRINALFYQPVQEATEFVAVSHPEVRVFLNEIDKNEHDEVRLVGGVIGAPVEDDIAALSLTGTGVAAGSAEDVHALRSTEVDFVAAAYLMERLSPRQQNVLSLMAEGRSNKEIAKALSLSVGTAKNYVSSILRVLGVARRGEAIRVATTLQLKSD